MGIVKNDELGVKSRFSFGIGGGNNTVQTEWQRLLFLTGIVENLEKSIETNEVISNVEWPFSNQHTIFKFAHSTSRLLPQLQPLLEFKRKDDIVWTQALI